MTATTPASDTLIEQVATALREAARRRHPVEPPTAGSPQLTVVDAYRVQQVNQRHAVAAGDPMVGHKIGLTSPAMQQQMGVAEPDFGYLLHSMLRDHEVALSELIAPRAEAEIALILDRDLDDPDASTADILAATGSVAAAVEIIDSRVRDWRITLVDTVADNASSGAFILGPPVPLAAIDLAAIEVTVTCNGETVATGHGRDALGHPAAAAAWLSTTLIRHGSHRLRAGDIVLTGALHASLPLSPGQRWHCRFTEIGSVDFTVVP